jgi:hypothetical protein
MIDSDIIVSLHLVIPFISMVQTVIYYQGANQHSSLLWLKKLKMLGQVFCNKKSSFDQKGFWSRHFRDGRGRSNKTLYGRDWLHTVIS